MRRGNWWAHSSGFGRRVGPLASRGRLLLPSMVPPLSCSWAWILPRTGLDLLAPSGAPTRDAGADADDAEQPGDAAANDAQSHGARYLCRETALHIAPQHDARSTRPFGGCSSYECWSRWTNPLDNHADLKSP
eukprot:8284232-Pyramimonas_sp.AAC.1